MDDPSVEFVDDAWRFLRGNYAGVFHFDEHVRELKVVVDPETGRLVASVMVAMLQAVDHVLFLPDDALPDDADPDHPGDALIELMVTPERFDEHRDGRLLDRWRIYHGDPPDVRWTYLSIDAARFGGNIIDGDALMRGNPLAADEPRVCRVVNEGHRDALREAVLRQGGRAIEDPVLVGVDPDGYDVRGAFEVHRVRAPRPALDGDAALAMLAELVA